MKNRRFSRIAPHCGTAGLVVLGAALPAQAANLLINSGFEAPTDLTSVESTTCTGWTFVNTAERTAFPNVPNHTPGGRWSVWSRTFESDGGIQTTVTVPVTGGTPYLFSSYLYFQDNFNQSGATAYGLLTWKDASNANVGTNSFEVPASSNPAINAWTLFSINPTAPAAATQVSVFLGWKDGGIAGPLVSQFFDDVVLDGAGNPPTESVWAVNGSGDWFAPSNWANGSVPNGVGASANFGSFITSAQTVYANSAVTVGTILFTNNSNTYVIAGAGSLTLQNSGASNAVISVGSAGTQKINLPMTVASNATFSVASGGTLKISDPVTVNAGKTISQTGAGAVQYESTVDVLTGGGIQMRSSSHMARLSLFGNSTATLLLGGSGTAQKIDSLALDPGATFDLNDNDLVTGTSKSAIETLIRNARNNGAWNAAGITSSNARVQPNGNTGLGVLSGAEYNLFGGTGTFAGRPYASTDTLVKYTWNGDANFSGNVNFDDYVRIDVGFNTNLTGWANGDFNYSGQVNFDDYVLIDVAFNTQSGTLGRAVRYLSGDDRSNNGLDDPGVQKVVEHFGQFGLPYANAFLAAVPEPTSLALLGVPALACMARRRRNVRRSA